MNEQISTIIKGLNVLQLDNERLMLEVSKHRELSDCRCHDDYTVTMADWEYLQEESRKYPTLADCRCGCHGDYTEHSMRAGESGRCSSIIIQD